MALGEEHCGEVRAEQKCSLGWGIFKVNYWKQMQPKPEVTESDKSMMKVAAKKLLIMNSQTAWDLLGLNWNFYSATILDVQQVAQRDFKLPISGNVQGWAGLWATLVQWKVYLPMVGELKWDSFRSLPMQTILWFWFYALCPSLSIYTQLFID